MTDINIRALYLYPAMYLVTFPLAGVLCTDISEHGVASI